MDYRGKSSQTLNFFLCSCVLSCFVLFCFHFESMTWRITFGNSRASAYTRMCMGGLYRKPPVSARVTTSKSIALLYKDLPSDAQSQFRRLLLVYCEVCTYLWDNMEPDFQNGSQRKFWRWWCKAITQMMESSLTAPAPLVAEDHSKKDKHRLLTPAHLFWPVSWERGICQGQF